MIKQRIKYWLYKLHQQVEMHVAQIIVITTALTTYIVLMVMFYQAVVGALPMLLLLSVLTAFLLKVNKLLENVKNKEIPPSNNQGQFVETNKHKVIRNVTVKDI